MKVWDCLPREISDRLCNHKMSGKFAYVTANPYESTSGDSGMFWVKMSCSLKTAVQSFPKRTVTKLCIALATAPSMLTKKCWQKVFLLWRTALEWEFADMLPQMIPFFENTHRYVSAYLIASILWTLKQCRYANREMWLLLVRRAAAKQLF